MNGNFDRVSFNKDVLSDPLVYDIWDQKYRWREPDGSSKETTIEDTKRRIVQAIFAKDNNEQAYQDTLNLVLRGIVIPAGRINAGAGTGRLVTLSNCFVSNTVPDCLPGIQRTISEAALTMQQGGGIGTDFSTIRPRGALVRRTGTSASGVIPFMAQQDAMCSTVISAGQRRGAMMATLRVDHPDLWNPDQFETMKNHLGQDVLKTPSFISAKRQSGFLTQFNVSVLVSDAFMHAVEHDLLWDLGFHCQPADPSTIVATYDRPLPCDLVDVDNEGNSSILAQKGEYCPWYVYRRVPAREIWNDIMRSTYTYSEPGVIFIDQVNNRNNLKYIEDIQCTNPCGEQPLPPNGACNLASINLAFLVNEPFSDNATFDQVTYRKAIAVAIRMLDNVLDVSHFPLKAQALESELKRRIGLGITGFADMLIQLQCTYGSKRSVELAEQLSLILAQESYAASIELAKERGAFPAFDRNFLNSPNIPKFLLSLVGRHGIRNGVLNTIAPNGTISVYSGNVASGCEPVFSFNRALRKVRQPDGTLKDYETINYTQRLYEAMYGKHAREDLPEYFVGAMDIPPEQHIAVQAAWQKHIDASISKTINVATELPFADFRSLYMRAYESGCKGCTTYRFDPASGRGSILSEDAPANAKDSKPAFSPTDLIPRPDVLPANVYKLRWPLMNEAWYVAVTHNDSKPVEVFITPGDAQYQDWTQALGRMITAVLRRGGNIDFLPQELKRVHAATGGCFMPEHKAYVPSIIAAIGYLLEGEFAKLAGQEVKPVDIATYVMEQQDGKPVRHATCPVCKEPQYIREQGCWHCLACGHEACG